MEDKGELNAPVETSNKGMDLQETNEDRIFLNFVKKFTAIFCLDKNHENEKITLRIEGQNVLFCTEHGAQYKADKTIMDENEWTTICGMLQGYDRESLDLEIPRTTNQHEINLDLTEEEETKSLKTEEDQIKQQDNDVNDKVVSTDPIAPIKEKPKIKSIERVLPKNEALNEYLGKTKRTVSKYHLSNVSVNDLQNDYETNGTTTNKTNKNEPTSQVSNAIRETNNEGQDRSEQKLLHIISDLCGNVTKLMNQYGELLNSTTNTMKSMEKNQN